MPTGFVPRVRKSLDDSKREEKERKREIRRAELEDMREREDLARAERQREERESFASSLEQRRAARLERERLLYEKQERERFRRNGKRVWKKGRGLVNI